MTTMSNRQKQRSSSTFKSFKQIIELVESCVCLTVTDEVQHIFHEHPLVNGEVSEPVMCNGCGEDIKN